MNVLATCNWHAAARATLESSVEACAEPPAASAVSESDDDEDDDEDDDDEEEELDDDELVPHATLSVAPDVNCNNQCY